MLLKAVAERQRWRAQYNQAKTAAAGGAVDTVSATGADPPCPEAAHSSAALDNELAQGSTFLPRLFLIESEYQRQVLAAELDYVKALVDDLRAERITWPSAP